MAGRTNSKWTRVYIDGYDLSGDARAIGPLVYTFDESDLTGFSHAIKGTLPAHATLGVGTFNAVLNNTASTGTHIAIPTAAMRNVMVAIGSQAEPAQGDPVYMGEFEQLDYQADVSGAYVNVPFGNSSARASTLLYDNPFGYLLRSKAAATTAVNSAVGIDDYGASTAFGGYMSYHVFAGNGTATIKVQHASTNSDGSFADLGGCTTGVVACDTIRSGRIATTARTTTVNRYLRWQIVLGTASSVTFALGFSRALR